MLSEIAPLLDLIVLTRVHPLTRCASQEQLTIACDDENIPWEFNDNITVAVELSLERAKKKGLPLVIFGSIYLAGEILKIYRRNHG
jgi:folylpolyglutamate synthase/dihydropteroate synthase